MKTKYILPISLVLLVGTVILVSAYAAESGVPIYKGWNLVYGFISPDQIQGLESSNIKAIYAFIPTTQEYVRLHPNAETDLEQLEDKGIIDDNEMLQTVFWVYSDSETGETFNKIYNGVEYWLYDIPNDFSERPIYKGWNFVAITPDMFVNKNGQDVFSWNGIKGSCSFEKIYSWNPETQSWMKISPELESFDFNDFIGSGMIVKVSGDCKLGTSTDDGGKTPPPEIPIDCQEDDGGKVISVKGTTTGMNWQGEQVSKTDVCEEENYDNYLREYYCLDNVVQNEGNFCPDGTTCSDGACK